jgi:hypothetical protein
VGDQLETKDAGEEAMEWNNWASQNSQRAVELKEEEEEELFPAKRFIIPNYYLYKHKITTNCLLLRHVSGYIGHL